MMRMWATTAFLSSCFICKKFVVHLQYEKDVFTCNNGVNHYIIV